MSTTHQISIEDYLSTAYRPDRDFVDGEVEERNGGEKEHSIVHAFFVKWFARFEPDWRLEAFPEIRIGVTENKVRIADIAVERIGIPYEAVLRKPPMAVVEILSPQDRVSRYQERLEDYRRMGIENVWVIDPMRCKAYDCSVIDWQPADSFAIAGTAVHVALANLWEKLAEMRSQP